MVVESVDDNAHHDAPSRDTVMALFQAMDEDNDGWISREDLMIQYKKDTDGWTSLDGFIQCHNRNGKLDFEAFQNFYYTNFCYTVNSLPVGSHSERHFSVYCGANCWEAHIENGNLQHGGGSKPFTPCSTCYKEGSCKHQHSKFLDNCMLLQPMGKKPDKTSGNIPIKPKKSSIETEKSKDTSIGSVLESGRLYYDSLGPEAKHIESQMLKYMDGDGNRKVCVNEAIHFLDLKGVPESEVSEIFGYMGLSDKDNLTVKDAVAVWYTFFMRPRCKQCKKIITVTYYSCVECHRKLTTEDEGDTWDLCAHCYNNRVLFHEHISFSDNFVLLLEKARMGIMPGSSSNLNPPQDNSEEVKQKPKLKKKKILMDILTGTVSAGVNASAAALCSIM